MTRFTITEDVFKSAATFVVNANFDELKKFHARYAHKDEKPISEDHRTSNGMVLSLKNRNGEPCYVVWVKNFDWTIPEMAVLAHELVHLAVAITHDKGIQVRTENDEVLAYLHEYYMVRAFRYLRKLDPAYRRKKSKRTKRKRAA